MSNLVLNNESITANHFYGGCYNCGYGKTVVGNCPFCLTANTVEETKAIVAKKYPDIAHHIEDIASSHPEHAVEWVAKSLAGGSGRYPEDKARFNGAWNFYHANRPSQRFKDTAKRLFPEANPKNPLHYSLHNIERIQDELAPEEQHVGRRAAATAAKTGAIEHEGASIYYDSPTHRIVQIGGPGVDIDKAAEAACKYGQGSHWCTRDSETAKQYLSKGPLYVFYKKGNAGSARVAQGHFSSSEPLQLMDKNDEPVTIDSHWEDLFRRSGLYNKHEAIGAHIAFRKLVGSDA